VMEGLRMRGLWRQGADERGMVLVVALFMMAILLMTGVFLVRMSSTQCVIAYSAMWSGRRVYAADAAINVGLDQITPTNSNMIATALYPAPPALNPFTATGTIGFTGTARLPGYSMGAGTGYNPGGFVFITYSVVGSGTGPRSTRPQIDIHVARLYRLRREQLARAECPEHGRVLGRTGQRLPGEPLDRQLPQLPARSLPDHALQGAEDHHREAGRQQPDQQCGRRPF